MCIFNYSFCAKFKKSCVAYLFFGSRSVYLHSQVYLCLWVFEVEREQVKPDYVWGFYIFKLIKEPQRRDFFIKGFMLWKLYSNMTLFREMLRKSNEKRIGYIFIELLVGPKGCVYGYFLQEILWVFPNIKSVWLNYVTPCIRIWWELFFLLNKDK